MMCGVVCAVWCGGVVCAVWCGVVVRCGVVWCGVVCGVVWCVVWCGVAWWENVVFGGPRPIDWQVRNFEAGECVCFLNVLPSSPG